MADVDPTSLPFQEAIDYFRAKANYPTEKWADMLHGAHAQAFTVAGATKDQLLTDLRGSIDQAINQGTTLETFRQQFDDTVAKHGWDFNGTRNWRTRVIYETNLWTSYSAGRYAQMTDPDVLRYQPFWEYVHSDLSIHPRPEHLAWNGLVLRADDAWWSSHYPPNGWGCKCSVRPLTRRELAATGKGTPDEAPPSDMQRKELVTSAGRISIDVPSGVDPGWGYSPGEAAHGRPKSFADVPMPPDPVAQAIMSLANSNAKEWERLTPTLSEASRPPIPMDQPRAALANVASDQAAARKLLAGVLGGDRAALALPTGDPVAIDVAAFSDHVTEKDKISRSQYFPLLPEIITDPFEVWAGFERNKFYGKTVLRKRILKRIDVGKRGRFLIVAECVEGRFAGWTFIPVNSETQLDNQRWGQLLYRRRGADALAQGADVVKS